MILLFLACSTPEPSCPLWFSDLDGDGYGVGDGVASCEPLEGRAEQDGDCDDRNASVHPQAIDPHDGIDQDCDGLDGCEGALVVQNIEDVDCALGQYVLKQSPVTWPEGDCICEVEGLLLPADQATKLKGGLQLVSGRVSLGSDAPWSGQGLEGLRSAERLEVTLEGDADLAALVAAESLTVLSVDGPSSLSAPELTRAQVLTVLGPVQVEMLKLQELESLRLDLDEDSQATFPKLSSVDWVALEGGQISAPVLAWVRTLSVGPLAQVRLPLLSFVSSLSLEGGLEAPRLAWVDGLTLYSPSPLSLPSLKGVTNLHHQGPSQLTLEALESAESITLSDGAALSLPQLTLLSTLQADDSAVVLPKLQSLTWMVLDYSELEAPFLAQVERLELELDVKLHTPDSFRAIETLETSHTLNLRMPELRSLGTLSHAGYAYLELPAVLRAGTVWSRGGLSMTALQDLETLGLESGSSEFPSLRSLDRLETNTCQSLPALELLSESVYLSCTLDLSGLRELGDPFQVTGSSNGQLILPDPLPGALWIDDSFGRIPGLDQERIEGALSINHGKETAAPQGFRVRHVGGQLYLSLLDATELGGLSHIEVVDGDVSYCMPLLSETEVDAWLSTMSVGGEVVNRCP